MYDESWKDIHKILKTKRLSLCIICWSYSRMLTPNTCHTIYNSLLIQVLNLLWILQTSTSLCWRHWFQEQIHLTSWWLLENWKAKWVNNGPVHKGMNHFPKAVSEHDSDPFLIWKPDFTLCERKALSNQAFWKRILICVERGVLDRDLRRKPDSEDMWTAKLFRNVICACVFWKCALKPCMGQSARTVQ